MTKRSGPTTLEEFVDDLAADEKWGQRNVVDRGPVECPDLRKPKAASPCPRRGTCQACRYCAR